MESFRERAVSIAQDMLKGTLDPFEGSRLLAGLRDELDMAEDSSFLVFTGVDSEADEWPLDHMRERCSDRMLKKADAEKQEYLDQVGPEIMAACREVIEKLV